MPANARDEPPFRCRKKRTDNKQATRQLAVRVKKRTTSLAEIGVAGIGHLLVASIVIPAGKKCANYTCRFSN